MYPVSYTHLDVYKRQLFNRGVIDLDDVVVPADEAPLPCDMPAPAPGSPDEAEARLMGK